MNNFNDAAHSLLHELLSKNKGTRAMSDKLDACIDESARTHVAFYHQAQNIIEEYEVKYGSDIEPDGVAYEMADWRKAMQEYAYHIARKAISIEVADILTETLREFAVFAAEVERLGGDPKNNRFGECIYSSRLYNYETNEGVMVWSDERDHPNGAQNPSLLDGKLIAVSHKTCVGVYLNWCATKDSMEPGE